ncbi:16S rRNA (adenine(1518)-N(6)/adenine(1519)-N(6))-dimethyltransferase RsmA [Campylobacter sp. 19-13652]|uniref:16S rRNA (adenine(1518)-N(6)/adenine(1519)-N(6))- dimethyltransferase RsmA n=1 Tax=Campylobacter sp. 19-13652 TaxID=2840180 RepID=UPI001C7629A3|nr:16S rRNA (adenine(1518)-N(6)/adenine(1519)-N(6))-dimethyltransferase RsmA [Campylobacter sp. 19-13652]BCX78617.1 ribosomal RNA small subunit methyltransferase A [Campylobacter sp. 19-13652]
MIKAKKKFGQNFLKDESIKAKIIQAIPHNADNIVEIGAGLGDLTTRLLELNARVKSYEIDDDLVPILRDKFKSQIQSGEFSLVHSDALSAWDDGLSDEPYFLVANLPYYVATKMILNAIKDPLCKGLLVMVQREVAVKFSAKSGSSEYSALAVLADLASKARLLFDVEAVSFDPPPKVTSSVIEIIKHKSLVGDVFSSDKEFVMFCDFLKAAFSAPRKVLVKNLASKFKKDAVLEAFKELKMAENIRPHELNTTLYLEIFKKVNNGK